MQDEWKSVGLGERPDSACAKERGMTRAAAALHRAKLGIGPPVNAAVREGDYTETTVYVVPSAVWVAVLSGRDGALVGAGRTREEALDRAVEAPITIGAEG